jgi:hypothetical protein
LARIHGESLLVDLQGEAHAVLGLALPVADGLGDWLAAGPEVGIAALGHLSVDVQHGMRLLPTGSHPDPCSPRWEELAVALANRNEPVVVDAGLAPVPSMLLRHASQSILVIRACYLALRRAHTASQRPDGIIVLREPDRALRASDIEHALGAPVLAELDIDSSVARAVDAGLLVRRSPKSLRALDRLAA